MATPSRNFTVGGRLPALDRRARGVTARHGVRWHRRARFSWRDDERRRWADQHAELDLLQDWRGRVRRRVHPHRRRSAELRIVRDCLRRPDAALQPRRLRSVLQLLAHRMCGRLRRPHDRRPRLRSLRRRVRRFADMRRRPLHVSRRDARVRRSVRGRRDGSRELRRVRPALQRRDAALQRRRVCSRVQRGARGVRPSVRRPPIELPQLRNMPSPMRRGRTVLSRNVLVRRRAGLLRWPLRRRDGFGMRGDLLSADGRLRRSLRLHELRRPSLRLVRSDVPERSGVHRWHVQLPNGAHAMLWSLHRHAYRCLSLRQLHHFVRRKPAMPRRTLSAVRPFDDLFVSCVWIRYPLENFLARPLAVFFS